MTQKVIDVGTLGGADGTGDSIRTAGAKINSNFDELYATSAVLSHIGMDQNEITSTQSNSDINLKPAGTGSISFPAIRINDNHIETVRTNDDLRIKPNGSGYVMIDGIGFSGTSIHAPDSSTININEDLSVSGSLGAGATNLGATTMDATLSVTDATTLSTLTVSGPSSFAGTTTIDNLLFNDNIISTSSNADLNLTPGGTGVVNVSNLTIDSSINLTDNVIKVTRSNDDFVLSANGLGSVQISKVDLNQGTVDNTVIGGTTPAMGTFTTLTFNPQAGGSLAANGVTITDNTISANRSNDNLELDANGVGYVSLNGILLPHVDGNTGQVLRTDGAGQLDWFTSPVLFDHSIIDDSTATVLGSSSVAQVVDTWSSSTYRSVKYHLQVSDATADRYRLIDANVIHTGGTAYISIFGGVDNGDGDGSSVYDTVDFSVDISGGNVRLLGTVNNTNDQVIKLVRRVINK